MARDYKKEYAEYHSSEKQKHNRALRNAARRKLEDEGLVRKGDGKDVDHKKEMSQGGAKTARSNLQAMPASKNRSFPRTATAGRK
jgi:hypothetical protein